MTNNPIPDTPLTNEEIRESVEKLLPTWTSTLGGKQWLYKELPPFESRTAAFLFVKRLYHLAQEMDHDPTITWTYRGISLSLTTHHADERVTMRDIELAKRIDQLL